MALQLSLFDDATPVAALQPVPPVPASRILEVRGARAAEAVLLERLAALAAEARRDPRLLARPVRVVVPSRSLRGHLLGAIPRASGKSWLGITVQTLGGLAQEVLERAGEAIPSGKLLLGWASARFARQQPELARSLAGFEDGFAAVSGTVRDLLDAGLEPAHAGAVEELLEGERRRKSASREELERARALVRVAVGADEILQAWGVGGHGALFRRAAHRLRSEGEEALPARAVFIHGFSDATGLAADLLESLLSREAAWLLLDRPMQPGAEEASESAFTEHLAERLQGFGAPAVAVSAAIPPGGERPAFFEAPGAEAEAREVARRVRALLDGGARPEGVGILSRDLLPYRFPLARHFGRLGIPFSALGVRGGSAGSGRLVQAFLGLLKRGAETPADRWLDAVATLPAGPRVDLRLALASLGAGRVSRVAAISLRTVLGSAGSLPLPIRQGLAPAESSSESESPEEGGEGERRRSRDTRRRLGSGLLRQAVHAARQVRERFADWPEEGPLSDHLVRLADLLGRDLGWRRGDETAAPLWEAFDRLEVELPASLPLTLEDLSRLLAEILAEAGSASLGGAGGGVQVMTVMEGRGRTWEHLFLVGFNRGSFPRSVHEDPLLPESLRRALRRVLPDVPLKLRGFDEERHLFAQLLSAAPRVTVSWQSADEDGRQVPRSPLLARLELPETIPVAPPLPAPEGFPKTTVEHALVAALARSRAALSELWPLAWKETAALDLRLSTEPRALAAGRMAVLSEVDPDRRTGEGWEIWRSLGPYFGFLGRDPGRGELSITHLERLAGCPWQLFLTRVLGLEPTPDPLSVLPGIDRLLLGEIVHRALERIVTRAAPAEPAEEAELVPVAVPWPDAAELEEIVGLAAQAVLAEEGIVLPGLARAVARRALPFLERARDLDWPAGSLEVLAVEHGGEIEVRDGSGSSRLVRFRADRVDRDGGVARFTDYKTGRPLSSGKKADTRREHFLAAVRAGTHLQAVAYAWGTGGDAVGRYLYLRPDREPAPEGFELAVAAGDAEAGEAFAAATATVLSAWDAGSFFPRLALPDGDHKEPGRCKVCQVAEACLRGDSGSRLRLVAFMDEVTEGSSPPRSPSPGSLDPRPGKGGGPPPAVAMDPGTIPEITSPSPVTGEGTGERATVGRATLDPATLAAWQAWRLPAKGKADKGETVHG